MDTRPTADGHDRERERLSAALPAYDIGAVLGRGAFAVVYAGRHRHLEREVAIKRLAPELLRETGGRDRFGAEARVLASLDHPHIVRVYDYVDREDLCAFVMERMHGGTLGDRLRSGRVSYAWACAVILAALQGLEHAHRKGVLHRDVKPENLLFGADDVVKVGDFGIAKVVGAQGARLAATTAAIGTPTYMAPEQVSRSAGPLGPATDVWAAGAVLYEMLAGEPPFALDGDIGEILLERVAADPRPLRDLAPDVPEELAAVVMRALARDPARRYSSAAAFAAALEPAALRAADASDLAATGIRISAAPSGPGAAQPPTVVEPFEPGRRRTPRRALLGIAAAAAVAAGLAATMLASSGGQRPAPSRAPRPGATEELPRPTPCAGCYKPKPTTSPWQIQLEGRIDTTVQARFFVIDGSEEGDTVGALRRRGGKVACYVNAGAWEDFRTDKDAFPPEVLGKKYEGFPNERWLDIRRIDLLAPILRARIDDCNAKGFDGLDPDNLDGFENNTGFPLTATDQLRFNIWLANEVHARGLSIGLKNDPAQARALAQYFDWAIPVECVEQRNCGQYARFGRAGKPLFALEYGQPTRRACTEAQRRRMSVVFKTSALNAPRRTCADVGR
ncbi:MAG: hypothetical protein E6G10_23735 [Actinobacteria bacterium]|nr:MAG: hypothetical protein E6G10_23735 [Actinomycetota bacterium]